jgi:hypothetical protein
MGDRWCRIKFSSSHFVLYLISWIGRWIAR